MSQEPDILKPSFKNEETEAWTTVVQVCAFRSMGLARTCAGPVWFHGVS